VVREVTSPRHARPQPKPGNFRGPESIDDRLETVARPPTRAASRGPTEGSAASSSTTGTSGEFDPVVAPAPPPRRRCGSPDVSGLATSSGSMPCRFAIIASGTCDGASARASAWRLAISSTTRNPTLCRVSRYSRPGFPRPTMSFTTSSARPLPCRSCPS
jgi:hypothetical protein